MISCILAHDLGTSGNKASLISTEGVLLDSATFGYAPVYPHSGWAEENPMEWWYAVCKASKAVLERHPEVHVEVVAVSGQMMGCLALDRAGKPLGNSLIWSDARAEAECEILIGRLTKDRYHRITGQPPGASYSLPKIMWQKRHVCKLYEQAYKFIQSKDFINYQLTGVIVTDPTDAAYTLAYDIHKQDWSDEILDCADIPKSLFPEVVPCETIIGKVTKEAAEMTGIPEGTLVAEGAGDGGAAHLGAACTKPGDSYLCLGSSTWLATETEKLITDDQNRMQSEPHVIPNRFVYLGTMQTGGMAYSWARNNLFTPKADYLRLEQMIEETMPGARGLLFLPYLMGERSPWNDLQASGAFLGVDQETTHGEFYRAVMEGVAYNLNVILRIIEEAVPVDEIVLIGGGGKSKAWRRILADVFQKPIAIPKNVEEGTSIGGAIIAGVGAGIFSDYSVAGKFLEISEVIKPREEFANQYQEMTDIFEESYHALKQINRKLSGIKR